MINAQTTFSDGKVGNSYPPVCAPFLNTRIVFEDNKMSKKNRNIRRNSKKIVKDPMLNPKVRIANLKYILARIVYDMPENEFIFRSIKNMIDEADICGYKNCWVSVDLNTEFIECADIPITSNIYDENTLDQLNGERSVFLTISGQNGNSLNIYKWKHLVKKYKDHFLVYQHTGYGYDEDNEWEGGQLDLSIKTFDYVGESGRPHMVRMEEHTRAKSNFGISLRKTLYSGKNGYSFSNNIVVHKLLEFGLTQKEAFKLEAEYIEKYTYTPMGNNWAKGTPDGVKRAKACGYWPQNKDWDDLNEEDGHAYLDKYEEEISHHYGLNEIFREYMKLPSITDDQRRKGWKGSYLTLSEEQVIFIKQMAIADYTSEEIYSLCDKKFINISFAQVKNVYKGKTFPYVIEDVILK